MEQKKHPQTSGDTIHILLPDQTIRSIPISALQISIGRGSENDIVLDETGVSHRHALINYDGEQYQVTDLKSTNGVFIDELRLSPETPTTRWLPGENLRIGEVWLRIEKAKQEQSTIAILSVQPTKKLKRTTPPKEPSPADEIQEKPKLDFNYVSAFTINSNLMVTPGKSVSAPVVLYNRSTKADIYYLELDGIPDEWTPNRPVSASVPANGQKEISLVFRPPASLHQPGRASMPLLRVASRYIPAQVTELELAHHFRFHPICKRAAAKTTKSSRRCGYFAHT